MINAPKKKRETFDGHEVVERTTTKQIFISPDEYQSMPIVTIII
jgi:hypothetical protein